MQTDLYMSASVGGEATEQTQVKPVCAAGKLAGTPKKPAFVARRWRLLQACSKSEAFSNDQYPGILVG